MGFWFSDALHTTVPELERLWALGLRPPTLGFEYYGGADTARVAWLMAHDVEPTDHDIATMVVEGRLATLRTVRQRFGAVLTDAHTSAAYHNKDRDMLMYLLEEGAPL